RENAVTPSGSIDTKAQQVYIRLDGALDDLQKIRDTTVVSGGRTLKLSDIADVKRGYEDPATFLVRHNGQPALLLSIVMKEGWNGLDLGKALVAEQKKISADLPAGITFSKVTDQAVNIREAVNEFMLKFFVDHDDGKRDKELQHELIHCFADVYSLVRYFAEGDACRKVSGDLLLFGNQRFAKVETVPSFFHHDAEQQRLLAVMTNKKVCGI